MFGHVVVNRPELKMKHYDEYQSYYCGLCRELKEKFGILGQISLTYDMTLCFFFWMGCTNRPHGREQPIAPFIRSQSGRSEKVKLQNTLLI